MIITTKRLLAIFIPVLTALLLVLFWEAINGIPKQHSLWSLDGSPLYNHEFKVETWRELTGTHWNAAMLGLPGAIRVFQPDDLLKFIFPPLVYHLMSWIGAFLLMTGAMLYFLYSYGIKGIKAAIPALAYGFSGYTFTLISAGHRATPMTMGYAVLVMALVRNGIRKNTISHFMAAGLACVYGIINQMDVMGLLLILIAAYGLLQLILHWAMYQRSEAGGRRSEVGGRRSEVGGQRSALNASNQPETTNQELRTKNPPSILFPLSVFPIPPLAKLAAAIALAAATFLIVAWPFLSQTFFGSATGRSTIESREEQIEQTGGNRWEFITNWSLPPEGALEFIAPSVFGRENVSRDIPYWGRLGQSMSWPATGQGFRNFRQHNLYVGGIQITLALYALLALFQRGGEPLSHKRRIEIIFWLSATVLTFLLALGRYTPLYRLIYHIPVIGNIRAPVKWFHLTEITIVVLMAFGLDALLKDLQARAACQLDRKKKKQDNLSRLPMRFAIGTTATAVVLLLASSIARSTGFGLQSLWAAHGLEPIAAQLRTAMASSLFHAALVFAALSTILWLLLKQNKTTADHRPQTTDSFLLSAFPISALLLVLAFDLAIAHRPYIHVQDVSAFYAPNPIADIVLEHNPPYRVADYLSSRSKHDPIWRNFLIKGVNMLLPQTDQRPSEDVQALFKTLSDNPIRLWELTSTRYIIGQRQQLATLLQHPAIRVKAGFTVTRQARTALDDSQQSPYVLLEYSGALPRAYLASTWEPIEQTAAISRLADQNFDPSRSAVVDINTKLPLQSELESSNLRIDQWSEKARRFEIAGPGPSLVVLTDAFNQGWQSSQGKIERCNGVFQGTPLPVGQQRLLLRRPIFYPALISLLAQGVLLAGTAYLLLLILINLKSVINKKNVGE